MLSLERQSRVSVCNVILSVVVAPKKPIPSLSMAPRLIPFRSPLTAYGNENSRMRESREYCIFMRETKTASFGEN